MFEKMNDVDLMRIAARMNHAERGMSEAYYGYNAIIGTLEEIRQRDGLEQYEKELIFRLKEMQTVANLVWRNMREELNNLNVSLSRRRLSTSEEELEKFFWA